MFPEMSCLRSEDGLSQIAISWVSDLVPSAGGAMVFHKADPKALILYAIDP